MNLNEITIIIPSLNPDEKFKAVVDGMYEAGFRSFVLVDDGSDEAHKEPFEWANEKYNCTVLVHPENQGKGQALKDAFKFVYEKLPEMDAAITIDGDGQHTPDDAKKLAERISQRPEQVVFGCRDFDQPGVPTHNKLGNKITSAVFRLLFGMKLSDTQTGLRAFPRKYLKIFSEEVEGTRFEYESNMLLYMHENRIPYSEVSIATLYIEENKSSHFHPVRDSIRIYKPIIGKATMLLYILTSLVCTVIDLFVFTLVNAALNGMNFDWLQILIATVTARVISATMNFMFNRNIVFKSKSDKATSFKKYAFLTICQIALSWLGVTGLTMLFKAEGFIRTCLKTFVDLMLFFISYQIQKHWVFKK